MRKLLRVTALAIPQTVKTPLLLAAGMAVGLVAVALLGDKDCFEGLVKIGGTAMGLTLATAGVQMVAVIRAEGS